MRIVPRSLFSRLVLVQLSVLIVALLASFAIHMHERGEALSQASGMQAAQRIADIVRLLEPLSAQERRRIVQVFSAPPLSISLDQGPLPREVEAEEGARAALFGAMLRRYLGEGRAAVVDVSEEQAVLGRPGTLGSEALGPGTMSPRYTGPGYMGPGAYPGQGPHAGPGVHGPWWGAGAAVQPVVSFVAQVRLQDGALVTFDSRQPGQTANWPYRLLSSLAILIAAVVVVSFIAVRLATRPLKALGDAAEELGRNIDRPPMPEQGPLEVVRAAHAFNTMQERLARHIRERTATLAAMSHDLKTPVSRLRLRAELLDDSDVKKKIAQDLGEMESMIHATLEFMRGGESAEKAQPVDMTALLESLAADAQDTGGKVVVEGRAAAPYPGRPQALKRCLGNLLDNALQYGHAATLHVEDGAERLVIRVRDQGPGIPEGDLEKAFEPFYRVEPSRNRHTGGTGLGLSIARNIAQLHGGTLVLRNLDRGGLEAVLSLPRG